MFTKNDGTYSRDCAVCGAKIKPFHIEMITAHEYMCYVRHPEKVPAEHSKEFAHQVEGARRSARASKAVATKRRKYTAWPSRKRDHAVR